VLSVDKYDAAYAGMLKMDFLGLTTMGMIARCLDMTGLTLEDLYAVPDDDPVTLSIFQRNDVTGIFEFSGRAARIVCRDVHPNNFSELADINAMARPGPLFSGTTAMYCDVKHGRKKAEHYHPIIDDITAHTYFQIIYQEQILKILQLIGDFDWTALADIRRIIAKKSGQAAFQVSMQNFQDGAKRLHGMNAEQSERIWKKLVTSGTYAFNIAHAISYSMLGWWCAYLKAHHPVEFFAASLYKSKPGSDSAFRLMKDALRHSIPILPPDINHSKVSWDILPMTVGRSGILAGFTSVPGIGDRIAENIMTARSDDPFDGWRDMVRAHGVGPKKAEKISQFIVSDDPFGLERTGRILDRVIDAIKPGGLEAPVPAYDGELVAAEVAEPWGSKRNGKLLTYIGIVKARVYQDIVENIHSRTGDDLDVIEANLKYPDKRKYCVLQCYDASQEEVYARINRFTFPRFRRKLETVEVGKDVVIVVGRKTPGFGNSLAVEQLYVIDPE
jgi:DNA polymerase-3 subunit alpha